MRDTIYACDGETVTFYHSEHPEQGTRHSPFFTVLLDNSYRIEKITVVTSYTGILCDTIPEVCTGRINGAKVEVLTAGLLELVINKTYLEFQIVSLTKLR